MNSAILLYISIVSPIILLIFFIKKDIRTVFLFYVLGATICLVCGEIDGFILQASKMTKYAMTINITPLVEEIFKALPVLFIALILKCESGTVIKSGVSLGVGFAVLETVLVFTENISNINIGWALMRGFGAGLVHSLLGLLISLSINKARELNKIGFLVIIASLSVAILFHSSYNILVQSTYPYLALMYTIFIYLLIAIIYYFIKKRKEKQTNDKL